MIDHEPTGGELLRDLVIMIVCFFGTLIGLMKGYFDSDFTPTLIGCAFLAGFIFFFHSLITKI